MKIQRWAPTETPSAPGETVEEVLKRIRTTGREEERAKFQKVAAAQIQQKAGRFEVSLYGEKCGQSRDFYGDKLPEAIILAYDWADARAIRILWR